MAIFSSVRMAMSSGLCVLCFSMWSSSAVACEKWKSEIAGAVYDLGVYINSYSGYRKDDISSVDFHEKASKIAWKLEKIRSRAMSVESCDGEKYEIRRVALVRVLSYSIPVIQVGNYLTPGKREELRAHED